VFFEDRGEIAAITGVEGLDQPVDPRGHDEDVACRLRHRVPTGVRRAVRDEQRLAGGDLLLLVSDPEAKAPLEDEPRLVVGAVQVQPCDRRAGCVPGSVQSTITNDSLTITGARLRHTIHPMTATPVTKRIHLLRHAKSSWDDPELGDHERPLAPRGMKAAARMAHWIEANGVRPELVLCSSALRACETLAKVEAALGSPRVVMADSLYAASADELVLRLGRVADGVREVLLVGHNPGLADLCQLLAKPSSERARLAQKLPTGALVTLETESGWADLEPECATIAHVALPRELD
jgi:phosphohistidine phosphatase